LNERIVMIFSPHDSPFILVFTADARSVGNSQLSAADKQTDSKILPTPTDIVGVGNYEIIMNLCICLKVLILVIKH